MTPTEHRAQAEALLSDVESGRAFTWEARTILLARAQAHALLSLSEPPRVLVVEASVFDALHATAATPEVLEALASAVAASAAPAEIAAPEPEQLAPSRRTPRKTTSPKETA